MSEKIIKYHRENIASVHLHLRYNTSNNRKQFIISLSKDIKNSAVGYAGFKKKQDLRRYLAHAVFDSKDKGKVFSVEFDEKKAIEIIEKAIRTCYKVIQGEPIHIFLFPTFSTFVKGKMGGTTGYTPWENTILIFINSQGRRWQCALRETVAHEFSHAVVLRYNDWTTLLDAVIFEGLAEHFREHTVGGRRSLWVNALSIHQSKELFLRLKEHLRSKDFRLYHSVFFGNKNYPLWSGYSIGYQIVRSFMKNNPGFQWKHIVTLPPEEILKGSRFKGLGSL